VIRSSVTFDAGVLVGLDRGDRAAWQVLGEAIARGVRPVVPAPVVTQAWRSPRQARLARALRDCRIEPTDDALARAAGQLCARADRHDAVDAIVVASAARRGDAVVTSDAGDIGALATHVEGVAVVSV
jgi:hypothetical protein